MKYTLLLLSAFFYLFICSCKKSNPSIPVPIPRLPASFTGMKTWRDAKHPTSTYRYHFSVTTVIGKDVVNINGNVLDYKSTDSSKTGYTLKYWAQGDGSGIAGYGESYASFIHATTGDTIYYTTVSLSIGVSGSNHYVTP